MGSKQSTANSPSRVAESSSTTIGDAYTSTPYRRSTDVDQINNSRDLRQRARSLTAMLTGETRASHSSAINVLSPFGVSPTSPSDILSVSSSDDNDVSNPFGFTAHSLPIQFFPFNSKYLGFPLITQICFFFCYKQLLSH